LVEKPAQLLQNFFQFRGKGSFEGHFLAGGWMFKGEGISVEERAFQSRD